MARSATAGDTSETQVRHAQQVDEDTNIGGEAGLRLYTATRYRRRDRPPDRDSGDDGQPERMRLTRLFDSSSKLKGLCRRNEFKIGR